MEAVLGLAFIMLFFYGCNEAIQACYEYKLDNSKSLMPAIGWLLYVACCVAGAYFSVSFGS